MESIMRGVSFLPRTRRRRARRAPPGCSLSRRSDLRPPPPFKTPMPPPDTVVGMRRAVVFALVLVGLATACSSSTPSMKWHLANVRNYTWTIEEFAMAGGDSYTVRVVDGTPDISPEWRPFGIKHPTTRWLTVEDLFAEIDNAPGKVDVTYDDELGYPKEINFDPTPPHDGYVATDDEWSLTVTKFEVNN
jgi:hypothetical protein